MSIKQTIQYQSQKTWKFSLNSKPAWRAIFGLIAAILVLLLLMPRLAILVFPFGSLAVGIYLYRYYPALYIGFTLWMWFVGPFVRRLIDYRCRYVTNWPFSLAPILVTSITIATLIRYLPRDYKRDGFPFLLVIGSIFYSFFIGLARQPVGDIDKEIIVLMSWLCPILFGYHLYINWKSYPDYSKVIQSAFLWGVLVMGAYGVIQFLTQPAWDVFFFQNNDVGWMGEMEGSRLRIRVWSTMRGSIEFAVNLMPGLILLLISKSKLRFPAAVFGFLAFLLSLARTAWYSWVVGMMLFVISLKERQQIKTFIVIATIVIFAVPLTTVKPFSEVISSRFDSIVNLESNGSYQTRVAQFNESIDASLFEVVGWGLLAPGQSPPSAIDGSNPFNFSTNDNGYLVALVSLGWFGTLGYLGGLALLFFRLFQTNCPDIFVTAARSIAFGSLTRLMTNNITIGDYAMPIWIFLGIAIAGRKYYVVRHQLSTKELSIS